VARIAEVQEGSEAGVATKVSPCSLDETAARFTDLLKAKSVDLFAVINQTAEARQVGLELRETTLVLFGSPKGRNPGHGGRPSLSDRSATSSRCMGG
jgi:hypothetical protein